LDIQKLKRSELQGEGGAFPQTLIMGSRSRVLHEPPLHFQIASDAPAMRKGVDILHCTNSSANVSKLACAVSLCGWRQRHDRRVADSSRILHGTNATQCHHNRVSIEPDLLRRIRYIHRSKP